jgi:hypothetical protein
MIQQQLYVCELDCPATLSTLVTLQAELPPTASNPFYQEELTRVHYLYQQSISNGIGNILQQYLLCRKLRTWIGVELHNRTLDQPRVSHLVSLVRERLFPLQNEYSTLEAEMMVLYTRMYQIAEIRPIAFMNPPTGK